jgi:hypothetical protein
MPSGLLLAEELARADLVEPESARRWSEQHGAFDLVNLFPLERFEPAGVIYVTPQFGDALSEVARQQVAIRWHLDWLARLSDVPGELRGPSEGASGSASTADWPRPAIEAPYGALVWPRGETDRQRRVERLMQRFARAEDVPRESFQIGAEVVAAMDPADRREWWSKAHAAYRTLTHRVGSRPVGAGI